jgi:hypothetical protein
MQSGANSKRAVEVAMISLSRRLIQVTAPGEKNSDEPVVRGVLIDKVSTNSQPFET